MKLILEEDKIEQEEPERIIPYKELSPKQKRVYIWEYYRWKILLCIVLVVSAVSIGFAVYENSKDSLLYAVFINTQLQDSGASLLMDEFADYADLDLTGKKLTLDTTLYINQRSSDMTSVSSSQKLLAMFTSIEMDVIVCDEANFQYYAAQDSFVELSDIFPQEFLDSHKDRLLTAVGKDGEEHLFGISLAHSPVLEEHEAFLYDPIFTVPVTRMEEENLQSFLSFLLGE